MTQILILKQISKFGGTHLACGGIWFKSLDIFRPNIFVRLTRMHQQSTTPHSIEKWQIYVVAACFGMLQTTPRPALPTGEEQGRTKGNLRDSWHVGQASPPSTPLLVIS